MRCGSVTGTTEVVVVVQSLGWFQPLGVDLVGDRAVALGLQTDFHKDSLDFTSGSAPLESKSDGDYA